MSISAPLQIGQYGANAAAQQQQRSPEAARAATVRYTQDVTQRGWANDLFAYVKAFDTNKTDSYTPPQIAQATGLNLEVAFANKPERIVPFLDLNHDGHVDTLELATAILHIDGVPGPPNGAITPEKRAEAEKRLQKIALLAQEAENRLALLTQQPTLPGGAPPTSVEEALAQADAAMAQVSHMGRTLGLSAEPLQSPFAFQPSVGAGAVFEDPSPLLKAVEEGRVQLSEGMAANLKSIQNRGLVGKSVAQTFSESDQALARQQRDDVYNHFQEVWMQPIVNETKIQERYNAFKSAQ